MRLFLTIGTIILTLNLVAQSGTVVYHEDPKITDLMTAYRSYTRLNNQVQGYRIQISFANDRQEVYNGKARLYKDFPNEKCYVIYEQPYYKLRLGDYTSRLEAYDKLQSVLTKYQGAFIVKDHIKAH